MSSGSSSSNSSNSNSSATHLIQRQATPFKDGLHGSSDTPIYREDEIVQNVKRSLINISKLTGHEKLSTESQDAILIYEPAKDPFCKLHIPTWLSRRFAGESLERNLIKLRKVRLASQKILWSAFRDFERVVEVKQDHLSEMDPHQQREYEIERTNIRNFLSEFTELLTNASAGLKNLKDAYKYKDSQDHITQIQLEHDFIVQDLQKLEHAMKLLLSNKK